MKEKFQVHFYIAAHWHNNKMWSQKKLSPDAAQHLAEFYQEEEILWNMHHTGYFNKCKRKAALERIGDKLGIEGKIPFLFNLVTSHEVSKL